MNQVSLLSGRYISYEEEIVSMHHLPDEDCICAATSKGDLLLIDMHQCSIDCVGSVDAGILTSLWSPDHELLVLVTGISTLTMFVLCR